MKKSETQSFFGKYCRLGIKVSLSIELNKLMKLNEYQRSRLFFDLGKLRIQN